MTIETINGKKFFEFKGVMISKQHGEWITSNGVKFDGRKVANFIRGNSLAIRSQIIWVKSVLNRFYGYNETFTNV